MTNTEGTIVSIPNQLQSWRFIKLCPNRKIPTAEMKGWAQNRQTATMAFDDPRLLSHLSSRGNYGVVADKDRFIVATDTKEVEQAIENSLPKTFSVRSPRHKTKHFYFYGRVTKPIHCIPTSQGDPCCDIRIGNSYVLGPGSTFENYGTYELADDVPIATITEEQLLAALDKFIVPTKEIHEAESYSNGYRNKELDFPIISIIPNLEGMSHNGDEIYGTHPVHGSTTGGNFRVNTAKNVWHCFRHNTGGGPIELLAVLQGTIKCEDCKKGALRGKQFMDTLQHAKAHGLINVIPPAPYDSDGKDGDDEKIEMAQILESLNSQYTFKSTTDTDEIYVYSPNEGIYKEAEAKLKKQLEDWLGADCNTHLIEEALNHIRRANYTDRHEFNKQSHIIPVQNGLLNLKTLKLEPFTPDRIFTYRLNAVYDPTKTCPKFFEFVNQVLEPEDIATLQEYMGYALVADMPYHKMLWLYGVGRNGKGRITATLRALFGDDNCAALNLEEFSGDRRFSVAGLYGKLVNEASEPATTKTLQTPILKKVTGEDAIDAEVKNKQKPIRFINFAKFFILGNRFPKVNDNTVGFWDRVLIIRFCASFLDEAQVAHIEHRWTQNPDEMSGILNWMLEGLHRLIMNNRFTVSKSTAEAKLEFKRVSDTVLAFLDEQCEPDGEAFYTDQDFYDLYKEYCDANGALIEEERVFKNRLKQHPKLHQRYKKIDGKTTRILKGLRVKPLKVEADDDAPISGEPTQVLLLDTKDTHDTKINNSPNTLSSFPEKNNSNFPVSSVSAVSSGSQASLTERGSKCAELEQIGTDLSARASPPEHVAGPQNRQVLPAAVSIALETEKVEPVGWVDFERLRLAPNDIHRCEGTTGEGHQCPHEATHAVKYKGNPTVGYFCRGHAIPVFEQSVRDGFELEAVKSTPVRREDHLEEDYPEPGEGTEGS